jgi:DnaA-homolog protein
MPSRGRRRRLSALQQIPLALQLRANLVFASFWPGPNAEALSQLRDSRLSPLWLWGPATVGKSHLLQAACAAVQSAAVYLPLAAQPALDPEILNGCETQRLVCLDDIDHIAGDLLWERRLFGFFNAAAESDTRLVLATRVAPRSIAWVLPDWASRAATAAVYRLAPLEEAERIEALRLRAHLLGLDMPEESAQFLLNHLPRDLRSLFDAFDAADRAALVAQRRLTVPFLRQVLAQSGHHQGFSS